MICSQRSGDSMTVNTQATERATGQLSPIGASFAVGALLVTSAILTFFVGVFALAAHEVVVSAPGYQYTFQMTGWGWVNILTGLMLAVVRTCRLHQSGAGTGCDNRRRVLGRYGQFSMDAVLPARLDRPD